VRRNACQNDQLSGLNGYPFYLERNDLRASRKFELLREGSDCMLNSVNLAL